ncbi:hypothetical protein N3Z16_01030 [Candidatus Megaera polyxenophila]|uniref:hypothetical protein n=1 Tax=Candidatus Megaera polyxenophila TaxID=988779 RepID=UPI00249F1F0F|nr:hypothetical protein N3Z16_01030 [Candidatus Megaera polyxenophila]
MKKILFTIFMTLVGLNAPAIAKEVSAINGSSHLTKGEYDSLKVNGHLTFNGLVIKDLLIVNGSIHGKNLECKTVKSNGSFDVDGLQARNVESNGSFTGKNIEIIGEAVFNGGVKITNGKLNDIKIATMRTTFTNTVVNGNILFKKVNNGKGFLDFVSNQSSVQVLELKGRSLIIGDLIFEEDGEIHLFDLAEVKGKIVNAKVIQK